jgi:hypothetical protein
MTSEVLREVIRSNIRERHNIEEVNLGGIIIPLVKMNNYDLYVYGAGDDIEKVIMYFNTYGVEVKGIFDVDKRKAGISILGTPIIEPNLERKFDPKKTFIVINTAQFEGMEQYRIMDAIHSMGIELFYHLKGAEKRAILAETYHWSECNRIRYYKEHEEELVSFFEKLNDDESKKVMLEYIRAFMECGVYSLKQCYGEYKYFFDGGEKKEIYIHNDGGWINCGSNIGENIFWFFSLGLNSKKIYAYEGNENTFRILEKNIEYLPDDKRKCVELINEYIDCNTDFSNIDCKISLINADIEGNELSLVRSLKDIIIKDRPVLALCAYHYPSDLVELPKQISDFVDEYVYVLRKYEAGVPDISRTAELVLYAIPRERLA